MIITISGSAGSGKSTLAKMLADKLGWERYYMGGIRRQKAKDIGMTLAEYNKLGETNPATDQDIDEYIEKLAKTKDNIIIEGRTAFHFAPNSMKIFIYADEKEAAKRIFKDLEDKKEERNEDKKLKNENDVLRSIRERVASDKLRYKNYYNIDVYDTNNYNFILDTTNLDIGESFLRLFEYVKKIVDK